VGDENILKQTNADISQEMYKLAQEDYDVLQLTSDATITKQSLNLSSSYMPNVTIDLNGHNLSIENDVIVGNGGTLTIRGEGKITGLDNIVVNGGPFIDNHTESSSVSPSEPGEEPVEDKAVAAIGDETFETLQAAVDASINGKSIRLLKPVDITETGLIIPTGKRITIDLAAVNGNPNSVNKKTYAILAGTGDKGIIVEGALCITDSDGKDSYIATTEDSEDALITVKGKGTLLLSKGVIESIGPGKGNLGSHAIIGNDNAAIKISGENRDAVMVKSKMQSTIVLNDTSTLQMNGGSLRNLNTTVVEDHSSKTITFGSDTYLRTGEAGYSNGQYIITTDTGKVSIAGGIYRTDWNAGSADRTVTDQRTDDTSNNS
ncbi:MAG: hypothetical protein VZR73_17810, partial [Acutalibacteraceae bacterium]|nr:hypothetical protein [Acutalibacteraceae bacterium]